METEGWEIRLDPPVGLVRPAFANPGNRADPRLVPFRTAYDLGDWLDWYELPSTTGSAAFSLVTTMGDFVLRTRPEPGARFETRLIGHLREAGYPAPRVVPARTGTPAHAGGALVTERLAGEGYDAGRPAHLVEAARALARYHDLVARFPDRIRPVDRPVLSALEHNGPHALATAAGVAGSTLGPFERQRFSRASSYLWSQFIRVPEALTPLLPTLRQLVIHGSFEPAALRYQGDRLTGVAGYERAAFELRAVDLASVLGAFGMDLGRCATFIAAYREVVDLPDHELEALPLVVRAQRLTSVLRQAQALNDAAVDDARALVDLAESEARRLRWLEANEYDVIAALGGRPTPARGAGR